ncbi:hypothetical protein MMC25_005034 [Agyrium rufum]|nr:hypothetical protein [Agyrium rufum]
MDAVRSSLTKILLDPSYAPYLALLKAARNGAVYGAKVRFPHALVMTLLFRSGTLRSKLRIVYKATRLHARNLTLFALIYKTTLLLLSGPPSPFTRTGTSKPFIPPTTRPLTSPIPTPPKTPHTLDPLVAGLLGGYLVFGRGIHSSVNQQIVVYIFARVLLASAAISFRKDGGWAAERLLPGGAQGQWADFVRKNAWMWLATGSWGCVMWIYRWYPEVLLSSLRSSMVYM